MDVAIIGASMTEFGNRDAWLRELLAEAGEACLADAGVDPTDVEQVHVANMAGGELEGQTGLSNALAADLGCLPAYTQRVDQTSASGGGGMVAAWQSVASGMSGLTLLVGGEKMTHRSTGETTDVISSVTHPEEYKHGVTLPSFGALAGRLYMETTDAPREAIAKVAVKNHRNALDNPKAQFHKEISVEDVLDSPVVADPMRLFDYCPTTDGSAALLLCPAEEAADYTDDYVLLSGVGGGSDTHVVHQRPDPLAMDAARVAGEQAFEMAGRGPEDVDVAELHDMVTVLEPMEYEAFGFAERGEGWRLLEEGVTDPDGDLPVNLSGGLKARGHPLGATGIAQAYELYVQLLGEAGARQTDDPEVGFCANVGGFANCVTAAVLEVAR
ncbi:MAG: thiolase family protein [Haloarculaceae archaeon]